MSKRKAKYDLDLSQPIFKRRISSIENPFPNSIEEAAFALVGLEPPTIDSIPDGKKISAFLTRKGDIIYRYLCSAIGEAKIKDLELRSLCNWAKKQTSLEHLLSLDVLGQVENISSNKVLKSTKLSRLIEEIDLGIRNKQAGAGGKTHHIDSIVFAVCDRYRSEFPEARISEFVKSKMLRDAIAPNKVPSLAKLRALVGNQFKNRSPGAPKSKY